MASIELTADKPLAIAFPVLAAGPDAVYGRARVEAASRPDVCATLDQGF